VLCLSGQVGSGSNAAIAVAASRAIGATLEVPVAHLSCLSLFVIATVNILATSAKEGITCQNINSFVHKACNLTKFIQFSNQSFSLRGAAKKSGPLKFFTVF